MEFQECLVEFPCYVTNSKGQDQPEDQGEIPVSGSKYFKGSDCQPI